MLDINKYVGVHDNSIIVDAFQKADSVINNSKYTRIFCSVSGGSDSDVMLDLCHKVDIDKKIIYGFCDTGLEYRATKQHLDDLELKYNIKIERIRPEKTLPYCVKHYGQPFISKMASENIARLQRHNFDWKDYSFEDGIKKYPNCKSSIKWWCNGYGDPNVPIESMFNINWNRYLKEFLIENPPTFKVSNKCCHYTKKKLVDKFYKENQIQLAIIGIRKSEGGVRNVKYKNCYDLVENGVDKYRPLFWFSDEIKQQYEAKFNIEHSKCYTVYGLKRTGCVGCPYNKNWGQESKIIAQHEPKLFVATMNLFKDAYDYTEHYRNFVKHQKEIFKSNNNKDIVISN